MKYLLDTNIPIYLEDPGSPFHQPVKDRFQNLQDEDQIFISVLSLYELYYGFALRKIEGKEQLAMQIHKVIEEIKKHFTLIMLTGKEASIFGTMKAQYKNIIKKKDSKKETTKKYDVDFIIASTAIEYGLTVISNDSIFQRIKKLFPKLKFENWT